MYVHIPDHGWCKILNRQGVFATLLISESNVAWMLTKQRNYEEIDETEFFSRKYAGNIASVQGKTQLQTM